MIRGTGITRTLTRISPEPRKPSNTKRGTPSRSTSRSLPAPRAIGQPRNARLCLPRPGRTHEAVDGRARVVAMTETGVVRTSSWTVASATEEGCDGPAWHE